jgi:hypothetical protein
MGELINLAGAGAVQKYDDKAFEASASSGNYLPRLQLMTSNSEKCKSGEFPINNYALVVGEIYNDLGKETDVLLIAWRPKAIEMGDAVISVYNHEDDEFKRIAAKSEQPNSGCMFGPEFLVWVPSKKKFATFFLGSKSGRKEAPALKALLQQAATLKSKKISTPQFTWFAAQAVPCNTPFDIPAMDDIKVELEKFNNPPAKTAEKAPDAGTEGRAR